MPNRLHSATSPYLLQHQDNPVDWYEWGDEAFAEAKRRDALVILSVGYSACHWCHVMAHESFEDDATARYMNEHFVNIKVDREERPDVDRVYMDTVTAMTGRGGWPMTVFLTPDAKPVFAGTYFPKVAMAHHPSFMDVMAAVVDAWNTNRAGALDQAEHIASAVKEQTPSTTDLPDLRDLERAVATLSTIFDRVNGGFGQAPKFPHAPTLEFLARMAVLRAGSEAGKASTRMLTQSLTAMANGGIYDHLFGGFARYSVDARWLIPHFEKMLYDNALLARIYLRSWQITGIDQFETVAREILDYLDDAMADERGALHSAEDADSEGEEGKFAVWSWDELGEALDTDRDLAAAIYGATREGNFEGKNNLHRFTDLETVASSFGMTMADVAGAKESIDDTLRTVRSRRSRPGRDDKIVTAWNGFALRAFAEAAAILEDDRYVTRATSIAEFLLSEGSHEGELVRSWRGKPGHRAFADDLASTAIGLYTLMSVTGEDRWFIEAERMVATLRERFADDAGGFFATATDDLITRPKNSQDNPTPSDNSLALEALQIHIALTGDLAATEQFNNTMRFLNHGAVAHPAFGGHALAVWLTHLVGIKEVAVVGTSAQQRTLARPIWSDFRPDVVLALGDGRTSSVPLLADRGSGDSGLAYVCQNLVCGLPVSKPEDLADNLVASDAQATS